MERISGVDCRTVGAGAGRVAVVTDRDGTLAPGVAADGSADTCGCSVRLARSSVPDEDSDGKAGARCPKIADEVVQFTKGCADCVRGSARDCST
jgi:hypothetical protein